MLAVSHLATGTIREQLQDCFLIDDALRLIIIADGQGPEGLTAAREAAGCIMQRLREVAPVTSPGENVMRLEEALQMAKALSENSESSADIAAVFINRGTVAAAAYGQCAVLRWSNTDDNILTTSNCADSWPAQEDQRLILCSEGMGKILDHTDFINLIRETSEVSEDSLQNIATHANSLYDGDDRCIIFIQTDKSDLHAGEPKEIELFEHYNREFSFPLWAPIALGASLSAAAMLAAKRLHRLWSDYR